MDKTCYCLSDSKLYDIFNNKCTEDISMYMKICQNSEEVLELGIGTGRVAIPLAESGVNVVGIDNSPKMLEGLYEKIKIKNINNIDAFCQDMQSFNLHKLFDYIIYPFCTFNFLLTIEEQEKALNNLHKYLSPQAIVVFDLMTPYTFSNVMQNCEKHLFDTYNDNTYNINIYISSSFNQSNQLFVQDRFFDITENGKTKCTTQHMVLRNRIFLLGEFRLLLERCGYKIIDIYGDYNLSSFTNTSKNLIVIASLY